MLPIRSAMQHCDLVPHDCHIPFSRRRYDITRVTNVTWLSAQPCSVFMILQQYVVLCLEVWWLNLSFQM